MLPRRRVLPLEEGGASGLSWAAMSLWELSFMSSSGHPFKEHHMSLSMPEFHKHLEGLGEFAANKHGPTDIFHSSQ